MIKSCDSGSIPPLGDFTKFLEEANNYNKKGEPATYLKKLVTDAFIDKIHAGIQVPNYPQFRDMNQMFLSMMNGIEKIEGGYIETAVPSLKTDACLIPEVAALEQNSNTIHEEMGKPFQLRVCVTGPYTLASFFPYRDERTFTRLGNIIAKLLEVNLFSNKHGQTSLASVDEPLFGLVDDPLIDFGSQGRQNLLNAWETICQTIKTKNSQTMIHLHSTTNELFWDINHLNIIDSHVDDPIQEMKKTRTLLESRDKFLKASITINDFDKLIKNKITTEKKQSELDINEQIADTWTKIRQHQIEPKTFLETAAIMKSRLTKIVDRFGAERIPYAGPECGLKGYPTYETAIECLKRVSDVVTKF